MVSEGAASTLEVKRALGMYVQNGLCPDTQAINRK